MMSDASPPKNENPTPDRQAGSPSAGSGQILRATRAYLLPPEVRDGLEMLLSPLCDYLLDAGMEELEELPVVALSTAIVDDLESALAAMDELDQFTGGARLEAEEAGAYAATRALKEALDPQVEVLRGMNDEMRRRLRRSEMPDGQQEGS